MVMFILFFRKYFYKLYYVGMEIQTIDEYFKNSVPNCDYWDRFIGSGKFDFEYLREQFDPSHPKFNKKNQYLLILFNQKLIGITIYRKIKYNEHI